MKIEHKRMIVLYHSGYSLGEIAKIQGMTRQRIHQILKENRIIRRDRLFAIKIKARVNTLTKIGILNKVE